MKKNAGSFRIHQQIIAGIFCGLLIFSVTTEVFGRVFWRRRAAAPSEKLTSAGNWQKLMDTRASVNEGKGRVEILAFEGSLQKATAELTRVYGEGNKDAKFEYGESIARATMSRDNTIFRIIALDTEHNVIAFILSQSPDEFTRSGSAPKTHSIKETPFFPDSVPRTFINVESTSAQMEVSITAASPAAALTFFESAMALNGWSRIMPFSRTGSSYAEMMIFQKGNELSCVMAQRSSIYQETIITVLHKRFKTI